jgi:prolipoprotein diacylglyceryl transferase
VAFLGAVPAATARLAALIPSPSRGVVHLGPLPLRAYALCILAGVFAAIALARRRWVARGGEERTIADLAVWAVPAGLIGARLYHVVTDYQLYTHDPAGALRVWDGGLGIWGGIAAGALTGLWVARRWGLDLRALLDAVAPALPLAQAIGRLGNWFNQELFGRPTSLPWGLRIDLANRPAGYEQYPTFHPTFLYELLWNLVVVAIVIAVDRRHRMKPGRLFAVYVAAYTFGRFWTEWLRIDPAHRIGGLRINDWTSVAVFVVAMGFVVTGRRGPDEATGLRPALESAGEGGGGEHGDQIEEAVGEHGRAQAAEADRDAEDHAGGADGDDHGDVGPPVERVEVGEPEDHGLEGHGPHVADGVEQRPLDDAAEEQLLDDRGADDRQ